MKHFRLLFLLQPVRKATEGQRTERATKLLGQVQGFLACIQRTSAFLPLSQQSLVSVCELLINQGISGHWEGTARTGCQRGNSETQSEAKLMCAACVTDGAWRTELRIGGSCDLWVARRARGSLPIFSIHRRVPPARTKDGDRLWRPEQESQLWGAGQDTGPSRPSEKQMELFQCCRNSCTIFLFQSDYFPRRGPKFNMQILGILLTLFQKTTADSRSLWDYYRQGFTSQLTP